MNFIGARLSTRAVEVDYINRQLESQNRRDAENFDALSKSEPTDTALLEYIPSAARTRANLNAMVEGERKVDATNADALAQFFASADVMAEVSRGLAGKGLSISNVGDAFAVYWVAAWQATRGSISDIDNDTYSAVAAQTKAALSRSPSMAAFNDAQKQELAETLLIKAVTIEIANNQAQGEPASLQKLKSGVKSALLAEGLDLDAMTLTEQGFVPAKKGSDAGAALDAANPNAADKALASAEGAGADSGGLSPLHYALIAAAAGAGLGGVLLLGKAAGRSKA